MHEHFDDHALLRHEGCVLRVPVDPAQQPVLDVLVGAQVGHPVVAGRDHVLGRKRPVVRLDHTIVQRHVQLHCQLLHPVVQQLLPRTVQLARRSPRRNSQQLLLLKQLGACSRVPHLVAAIVTALQPQAVDLALQAFRRIAQRRPLLPGIDLADEELQHAKQDRQENHNDAQPGERRPNRRLTVPSVGGLGRPVHLHEGQHHRQARRHRAQQHEAPEQQPKQQVVVQRSDAPLGVLAPRQLHRSVAFQRIHD